MEREASDSWLVIAGNLHLQCILCSIPGCDGLSGWWPIRLPGEAAMSGGGVGGKMDRFAECAGCINQILSHVNCKDDNEMKYFNNLLIVCTIIWCSSSAAFTATPLVRPSVAVLGSFPAQIVALCPPNAIQRRLRQCLTGNMFIIRSYLVRLARVIIIIQRGLYWHSLSVPGWCPRGEKRRNNVIGLPRSPVIANVNLNTHL